MGAQFVDKTAISVDVLVAPQTAKNGGKAGFLPFQAKQTVKLALFLPFLVNLDV